MSGIIQDIDLSTALKELDAAIATPDVSKSTLKVVQLSLVEVHRHLLTSQNQTRYVLGLMCDVLVFTEHRKITTKMLIGLKEILSETMHTPFSPNILTKIRHKLLNLGFSIVPQ
jgi:hypothetical protein